MRSTIATILALLACSCATVRDDAEASAAAEVLATLESWSHGWAEADAAIAVQDYAEDADWTNAFGDRFQGRAALREGLEFIFSLGFVMAGESSGNQFAEVTFVTPDVALVRSKLIRVGQEQSDGSLMPDRHINHLRVLHRRDGRWLIVSHLISQALAKR
ncbi:MAG: SgcJ/EcaC family oxidoreductase [Planctomycetota bacterium]|nr:SgcJ/EcaC family oxidoreductase [Planctomycetota bacterium]